MQLLDLAAMRASQLYKTALERAASGRDAHAGGWFKAGLLGDQTLYTFFAADYPGKLVHALPCQWNRQLGSDFQQSNRHADHFNVSLRADAPRFGFTNRTVHACPHRCALLHANLRPLKCIARFMHANPSCETWAAFIRVLTNGTAGSVHDLLIGSACPGLPLATRRTFAGVVRSYFGDCCIRGFRGPLRSPEGPRGIASVATAVQRLARKSSWSRSSKDRWRQ